MGPDAASWCTRECVWWVDFAGRGSPLCNTEVEVFFNIEPLYYDLMLMYILYLKLLYRFVISLFQLNPLSFFIL